MQNRFTASSFNIIIALNISKLCHTSQRLSPEYLNGLPPGEASSSWQTSFLLLATDGETHPSALHITHGQEY
jgi:hypothetical protein